MSSISELIKQLEKEDEERRESEKREFAEQQSKYEAKAQKMFACTEKIQKHVESINAGLKQLLSHKHTIEKALKEREDFVGPPIPHEHHGAFIDMATKATKLMQNPDILDNLDNPCSIQEVQNDVVTTTEKVSNDLEEFNVDLTNTQSLLINSKVLKNYENYISNED